MTQNRTQDGKFRCEDCGKTFSNPRELREHEEMCEARTEGVGADRVTQGERR